MGIPEGDSIPVDCLHTLAPGVPGLRTRLDQRVFPEERWLAKFYDKLFPLGRYMQPSAPNPAIP